VSQIRFLLNYVIVTSHSTPEVLKRRRSE